MSCSNGTLNTRIGFENHRIHCIIGVLPEERNSIQEISVDLKVSLDITNAIKMDDIQKTLDYTVLAEICTHIAVKGKYYLLETYASHVLHKIFSCTEVTCAWIRVKKSKGLLSADHTFVEMERSL